MTSAQLLSPLPRRAPLLRTAAALLFLCLGLVSGNQQAVAQRELSVPELERIGQRIWQNECAGTKEGLTSWNTGESFASLGIGHFIWYPEGQNGPFDESFPKLVDWFRQTGVAMPRWLSEASHCPWPDRASFLKDRNSPRQKELRDLLARTVKEQTRFIIARLNSAAPAFEAAAGRSAPRVAAQMRLLGQTAAGNFAMIDYVNFKGEGLKPGESYKGEGWGLLQVLLAMETTDANGAPRAFANASKQVLTRRVNNSPPERKERVWLQGWLNRCENYAR